MNQKWKRGAVVGIASAALLTAGGGAAMATGSNGASHDPSQPLTVIAACAPFKASAGKPGMVFVKPTGPMSRTSSVPVVPSAGKATLPSVSTRTLPRQFVRATGSCQAPKGPICTMVFSTGAPGKALRLARRIQVAKPAKGAAVLTGPAGVVRIKPGGCATVELCAAGTGVKSVWGATALRDPKAFVFRCGPAVKAKR